MHNTRKIILACIGLAVLATLSVAVFAQGGGGGPRSVFSWAVTERFYDTPLGDKIASGLLVTDRYIVNQARFISPGNTLVKINGPFEISQIVLLEKPFIFESIAGQPASFIIVLKNGQWYKTNPPSGTPPTMQMPVWDYANKIWKLGNPPPQGSMPPTNPPQNYMYVWDGTQYVLESTQTMMAAQPLTNYNIPFWDGVQWLTITNAPMWVHGWDGSKYYVQSPAPWPMPTTMPAQGYMWAWMGNTYSQMNIMMNPPPMVRQSYDIGTNKWVFVQPPAANTDLPLLVPDFGRMEKAVVLLKNSPTAGGFICSKSSTVSKAMIIPIDATTTQAVSAWSDLKQAWQADVQAKANTITQGCQAQYSACRAQGTSQTICDSQYTTCTAQATQLQQQFTADVAELDALFNSWRANCRTYAASFSGETSFCPA